MERILISDTFALKSQDWLLLKDLGFFDFLDDSFIERKIDRSPVAPIDDQVEIGASLAESLQGLKREKLNSCQEC